MANRTDTRGRILEAATKLLEQDGRDAVTTRAVCAAAGVQAPTLYRQFRDMDQLLDEVAAAGFEAYLAEKAAMELTDDPVADLRTGWDTHVAFGLAHPGHYLLMYGRPAQGTRGHAAVRALDRLRMLVERIAVAGRLRVPVDAAVNLIHAAGSGVTLTLIQTPADERDPSLPDLLADAVIGSLTTATPSGPPDLAQRATGLLAVLDQEPGLYTPGEQALLAELLGRAATSAAGSAAQGAQQ